MSCLNLCVRTLNGEGLSDPHRYFTHVLAVVTVLKLPVKPDFGSLVWHSVCIDQFVIVTLL